MHKLPILKNKRKITQKKGYGYILGEVLLDQAKKALFFYLIPNRNNAICKKKIPVITEIF